MLAKVYIMNILINARRENEGHGYCLSENELKRLTTAYFVQL